MQVGGRGGAVYRFQLPDSGKAGHVGVSPEEGLVDHVAARSAQLAPDSAKELDERQLTVLVGVKVLKTLAGLELVKGHAKGGHRLLELLAIKGAIPVEVELFE